MSKKFKSDQSRIFTLNFHIFRELLRDQKTRLEHELLLQRLLAALHDVLEGCREFQLHFEHVRGRQGQILAVLEGLNCETPNQRVRVGELLDFCCVDEIHI